MCALFGFLDCGRRIPLKALQKLVQALANASEVRGDHASGISYMKDKQLTIYKRPRPAHKMKFRLPKDTTAVMGHTGTRHRAVRSSTRITIRSGVMLTRNSPLPITVY